MRTLREVFDNDLSAKQKKVLLNALAQRWSVTQTNARKGITTMRFKSFTDDIEYMYRFHAIGFDHKKGFFLDLDRLKELREKGQPIPQLFGLTA